MMNSVRHACEGWERVIDLCLRRILCVNGGRAAYESGWRNVWNVGTVDTAAASQRNFNGAAAIARCASEQVAKQA